MPFVRGDANGSLTVSLVDVLAVLNSLFGVTIPLACADAGDVNDDGTNNIIDPIFLLNYLFANGAEPPAPFPNPGLDPTPDPMICL